MNLFNTIFISIFITNMMVSMDNSQPVGLNRTEGRPISQSFDEAKAAIQTNNVEKIRALLRTNPDILKQTDSVGQNLLILTIISGIRDKIPLNLTIFRLLLDAGISIKNPNYLTLLASEPGRKGSIEAMHLLIEKGADINGIDNNKMTPLMMAAKYGNAEAVKLLLQYGLRPLLTENLQENPGSYFRLLPADVTKKVLPQYAINTNIKNIHGQTALDLATIGLEFQEKLLKDEWYLTNAHPNKSRQEMVYLHESQKKDYQEIIDLLKPITSK